MPVSNTPEPIPETTAEDVPPWEEPVTETPLAETQQAKPSAPQDVAPPQFVAEELPDDFWDREEPPPASPLAEDDLYQESSSPVSQTVASPSAPSGDLADLPLFAELQSLFPGKIVRIEATQNTEEDLEATDKPDLTDDLES